MSHQQGTEDTGPGRAMDALVYERVFGHCRYCQNTAYLNDGFTGDGGYVTDELDADGEKVWRCGRHHLLIWKPAYPEYSTSIADAWQVVEKIAPHPLDGSRGGIEIRRNRNGRTTVRLLDARGISTDAATAPHAICLAALAAVAAPSSGNP